MPPELAPRGAVVRADALWDVGGAAGAIEFGLHGEPLEQLEQRLAELPVRCRGGVAWYPAEVAVIASVHGLSDGFVRDAILREVASCAEMLGAAV